MTTPSSSATTVDEGHEHVRKRQRVLYSCTECHRRKQKCNRETPCLHCIARKAPHLCVQYRPGYDTLDTDSRISRLEMVVDRGLEQILDRLHYMEGGGVSTNPGGKPSTSKSRRQQIVDDSTHDSVSTTSAPVASHSVADLEVKGFDPLAMTLPYDSASATYASLRAHLYPGEEGEVSHESSRLAAPASRFLEELPEPERCRELLNYFFDKVNVIYLPLSAKILRPMLETLIESGPAFQTADLHRFSILASILALALFTATDDYLANGPMSRIPEARSLLHTAHLALLTVDTLQANDLDKVTAWILLSRVFSIDERMTDAWQAATRAVTEAFAINLHKEPKMAILRQDEEEERRRIWSMVYFQEKSLSIVLNRPSTIQDALCTTLPPISTSQHDASIDDAATILLSQFVYFHTLAQLMGKVNIVVQQTDGNSHFNEALEIDASLCHFRDTKLPPFFHRLDLQDVDAKDVPIFLGNSIQDMIIAHQWIVASEIDSLRIALHRPFLSPSSVGSQQSRAASIEASSQSLTRRSALVRVVRAHFGASERVPRRYSVLLKQSQRFQLVLACCVSLLLNPQDGDALKLRTLIKEYMDVLPRRTQRSLRDADYRKVKSLEREFKVLQLFLDRASSLSLPYQQIGTTMASTAATMSSKTLVEQATDVLNSSLWPFDATPDGQPSTEQGAQQLTLEGANTFFDFLSQENTDETELQNSLLEVMGSIPWSFE